MSSKDFGLGPKWWQKPGNKLKKCSERKSPWCDPTETDGCCAVISCMYCLELDFEYSATKYGEAEFPEGGMGWQGTVGGATFFGFWEVGYESGVCEFVVQFNGQEVYRKSCDQGQSCRDSSDEVGVVLNYEDAVLRWVRHEYRPLPYGKEPDTNCTIHFCGTCECTCECICVLLVKPSGVSYRAVFCDSAYDTCLAPVWEGPIGGKQVRFSLARDQYTGNCIVPVMADGVDYDAIEIGDCQTLSGSITLEDYSELSFSCKRCSCEDDVYVDLPNCLCSPMGMTLNATMTGSGSGACSFSGQLTMQDDEVLPTWDSELFVLPVSPPINAFIRISCVSRDVLFPSNGFTAEDLAEVNSAFWYLISVINADSMGPVAEAFPFNYREPDTLNGWVGRCRDGFFAVAYFLNTLCGGVGDGLVSIVITE